MYLMGTHISHRLVQAADTVKWCHISPVITDVVEGHSPHLFLFDLVGIVSLGCLRRRVCVLSQVRVVMLGAIVVTSIIHRIGYTCSNN